MPMPEVAIDETVGLAELVTSTCETAVCHHPFATYSLDIQNALGLLGSGIAVE